MASNANRKRTKGHETVLEKTMKRFDESWDYAKANWHDLWNRDNKLYNNQRVKAQYHGVTDTFVPMTFSTVETITTALNNANLRFDYKSGDPLRQASTAPLNALIDEWWDDDQWDLAFEESEREMLITGMAPFMLAWEGDHPHLTHGSMRDFIVDPTISQPHELQQSGSFAGRRYLVRKGSLDEYEVVDSKEDSPTYGQMIKRFKMPRNAGTQTGPADMDTDKTEKERYVGSTLASAKQDQDEVIEIWDIDRVVTVLNRQDVIEDVENPYKARHRMMLRNEYIKQGATEEEATEKAGDECRGLVPFFFFRNYRRSSLFYAKSEIDSIASPQELLNDFTNMESDAVIKTLSRQRWLDPKHADWLDLINDDPDTTYLLPEGAMGFYDSPRVDGSAFNNRMNLKNEIRETTAVDQLAKGIANIRPTTATEVKEQTKSTSERIESKARILEKDGLYWMAHILFRMFQLYVDEPLVIEVKGADLDELKTTVTLPNGEVRQLPRGSVILDPNDYRGDKWRPKVTLEVDAQSKQADEQRVARENYQMVIADPTNNLEEAKKIYYPKMSDLDKDEIDRIITPDPTQQAALAGGLPPEGAPGQAGLPVDGATPPEPVGQLPTAPGAPVETSDADVDLEALQQLLTPEELAELQAVFAETGSLA